MDTRKVINMGRLKIFLAVVGLTLTACGAPDAVSTAEEGPPPTAADETLDTDDSGSIDEEEPGVIDDGQGPAGIDLDVLTNRSWTLRFGGGPEGEIVLIDGYPITITFDGDGSFGGTAACNGYGGTYQLDGNEIFLGEVGSDEAGCEPEVLQAEGAFFNALVDITGIDLVGEELVLSGPASELIFASRDAAAVDVLYGRSFQLVATLSEGVPTPVAGNPAVFSINPDDTFLGSTGCRDLEGSFAVSGAEVFFTDFAAEGECPSSLADQDGHVVGVLGDGFTFEFDGGQLLITSPGNQGLQYLETTDGAVVDAPEVEAPIDTQVLAGVVWAFVGGDSPDGIIADPRTIDPDAVITLTLADGEYEGEAVCNSYGGTSVIGESLATVNLGLPAVTEEGCDPRLTDIVNTYLSALPQMTEGGLENDGEGLVLNNGTDIELQFERLN